MTLNSDDLPQCQFISPRLISCGQLMPNDLRRIANRGYAVVINLSDHKTLQPDFDEKNTVESCGMQYFHIPVIWQRPRQSDFDQFIRVMGANRNKKVVVHCVANKRASVFLALYRMEAEGVAYETAMKPVLHVWKPDLTWTDFILSRVHAVA